jgi:hypothetical protein
MVWPDGAGPRGWPVPADLPVSTDGSARAAIVDRDRGRVIELHGASRLADGGWRAKAAFEWRLDAATHAPADAAEGSQPPDGGMPFFAGLVRHDEAASGAIRHALRVTMPALRPGAFAPPARRAAAGPADGAGAPVGTRLRLRPDWAIPADASVEARAILQALKTYGMIVAGPGPAWRWKGRPIRAGTRRGSRPSSAACAARTSRWWPARRRPRTEPSCADVRGAPAPCDDPSTGRHATGFFSYADPRSRRLRSDRPRSTIVPCPQTYRRAPRPCSTSS